MSKEILELIERVLPDDTAAMDEIDARVWCFVKELAFEEIESNWCWFILDGIRSKRPMDYMAKYTRSLDAQEAIDTNGWFFDISNILPYPWKDNTVITRCRAYKWGPFCISPKSFRSDLSIEVLARLHAKIQIVDYERNNK